jgi:hypothetical protein
MRFSWVCLLCLACSDDDSRTGTLQFRDGDGGVLSPPSSSGGTGAGHTSPNGGGQSTNGGNATSQGGTVGTLADGGFEDPSNLVDASGGISSGSTGGATGDAGTTTIGGSGNESDAGQPQVDLLEPYDAPDCDGFTAYNIPVDSCIRVVGRFEVRSPGHCEIVNPQVDNCATVTNIGQNDGQVMVRYFRAEDGYSFSVSRHEVDGQVCAVPCSSD